MDGLAIDDFTNEYIKSVMCILPVIQRAPYLSGAGVFVAVIDSGIDYFLPEFIDAQGNSKIYAIYDQTIDNGKIYTNEQINEAIKMGRIEGKKIVPTSDITGHGTAVAAVAAGNRIGIATGVELIIVKLGNASSDSFPRTTQLMRAINYVVNMAVENNRPIAINISFGNTYGDHKGDSLLERFIDSASEIGKSSIIIGSGNEGISNGHISGTINQRTTVELSISDFETGLNIQLWKNYFDKWKMTLVSPNGKEFEVNTFQNNAAKIYKQKIDNTDIIIYVGVPQPYNFSQEVFIDMIPDRYIESGLWRVVLEPIVLKTGEYDMYLPGYAARNAGTGFVNATPDMTITIPATARRAISVGAYNAYTDSYAEFSGRGYVYKNSFYTATRSIESIVGVKPELVAPGVNIRVPLVGGGYDLVSGTSFATPIMTGVSALLMEWGIVRRNDIYLYGEKLKSFLTGSAKKISSENEYPNSKMGWGKVCVANLNL